MTATGRKMTKAEAGRKGGETTFKKHGREWMSSIGAIGGFRQHQLYSMEPIGQNNFAYVHRKTNVIVATQFPIRSEE